MGRQHSRCPTLVHDVLVSANSIVDPVCTVCDQRLLVHASSTNRAKHNPTGRVHHRVLCRLPSNTHNLHVNALPRFLAPEEKPLLTHMLLANRAKHLPTGTRTFPKVLFQKNAVRRAASSSLYFFRPQRGRSPHQPPREWGLNASAPTDPIWS